MRVVFVTPELAPIAKVGGLGDVAASLPRALARLGHEVLVIVPGYGDRERIALKRLDVRFQVDMDGRPRSVRLSRARLNNVPTIFIENEDYFDGRGIYGEDGVDYEDNAFRFALFSRAALAAAREVDFSPDVFHVHDWQTALLPVYRTLDDGAPDAPTVLTLHNMAYQGLGPSDWLERLSLPRELFRIDGLEFYGRLNFLKGGLVFADRLTTVSPRYAREIQTEAFGAGLEGVLRERADVLDGILNGIEPKDWHPGRDPGLVVPFASTRLAGKQANKEALQRELGLRQAPRVPLLAAIGRLVPQKGFDLLLAAAPRLVEAGAQLVVLGSGNEEMLASFRELAARFPEAVSANRGFQDALGRRIYAGADLFLMPSRYEPCGLGQMIALRYGTIPIVRATGGLADSVRDLDEDEAGGNGFTFEGLDVPSLLDVVGRALGHYEDERRWRGWVRRAMREDLSWTGSAAQYVGVYERAVRG